MTETSADRSDSGDATNDGTLYERLGGNEAIASVVDEFYDRMLDDERIAGFFENVDMASQRAHQTQFLSSVTGGPVEYSGADMREAHEVLTPRSSTAVSASESGSALASASASMPALGSASEPTVGSSASASAAFRSVITR